MFPDQNSSNRSDRRSDNRRHAGFLITAALAVAISGCGGSNGKAGDTDTGMTGGNDNGMKDGTTRMNDQQPPVPLVPGDGLTRSTEDSVKAGSAASTLAALLPDETNRFAPLSTLVERDSAASTTTTSESHVKTISSDGNNGFHVTYVVGSDESAIHFEADDYVPRNRSFYKEVEGVQYWFWSVTGAFNGTDKNRGSSRYKYVDLGSTIRGEADGEDHVTHRGYMSYGVRAAADGLPAGAANYSGTMDAETYLTSDPSRSHRESMRGILRLTANFDDRTLEGMVLGIRARTRNQNNDGWNAWETLPETTHFEIGEGRIIDGQFTATLTGMDSDAGVASRVNVRGYEGGILGEFYGPAANEVGGVLNASRQDRVMLGVFAGKQSATGLNRSTADPVYATTLDDTYKALSDQGGRFAPLTSALQRDSSHLNVMLDDDAYVKETWIDGDVIGGSGTLHVTYVADGEEHTIGFTDADYDDGGFQKEADGAGRSLWILTGSFEDDSESEYQYLHAYGFQRWMDLSHRHHLTFGARTDPDNLPAGSATYDGGIRADSYPQNDPSGDSRVRVRGDLSLMADFDDATLGGTVSGMDMRGQNESDWSLMAETTSLVISNGQIANGQFTATLTGMDTDNSTPLAQSVRGFEGNVLGEFYGPAAEEVGGVFSATREEDNLVAIGSLYGRKQQ